jgi:hypothetical protein
MKGFAAAARCVASTAPGRRSSAVARDSGSAPVEACWYMPLAGTQFLLFVSYVHVVVPTWVPTWVRNGVAGATFRTHVGTI